MKTASVLILSLLAFNILCEDSIPELPNSSIPKGFSDKLKSLINKESDGKGEFNKKQSIQKFAQKAPTASAGGASRAGGPSSDFSKGNSLSYAPGGFPNRKRLPFWIWPQNPCNCGWNFWCIQQSFWNLVKKVWKYFYCLKGLPCWLRKQIARLIMQNFLSNCPWWLKNFLMSWFNQILNSWCKGKKGGPNPGPFPIHYDNIRLPPNNQRGRG